MYATKPLSFFKSHPEAASRQPPEGRNSGYLVVKGDEDGDNAETCCWGHYGGTRLRSLPFPQDRVLTVRLTYWDRQRDRRGSYTDAVVFVPVPDQPIGSNRYYAVIARGKRKGLVRTCSRLEDMTQRCLLNYVTDVKPRPFDPADLYQQIEIVQRPRGEFTARAVAPDAYAPVIYLRYWHVFASKTKYHFDLGDAPGINAALRSRQLADASIPTAMTTAVGKWYCPFYLIKEDGVSPSKQMGRGMFYEVALEQRWEPVGDDVRGDSRMYSTRVLVGGSVEARQVASIGDGCLWFRAAVGQSVGVRASVWERMRWEEHRGGWVEEEEEAGNVAGRSVLVERFVVRRMDGSVVVAFEFLHLHKVRGNKGASD